MLDSLRGPWHSHATVSEGNQLISKLFSRVGSQHVNRRDDNAAIVDALDKPFEILCPSSHTAPFIFNSPHSGRCYPRDFVSSSRLDVTGLRRSEDTFVEQLFSPVVSLGVPLMHAHFPRAYLDVNREPYELDPALIAESLPQYANTQSVRVVGGLGTIARVVAEAEEIYAEPMALGEALGRINAYYKPYHETLDALMTSCIDMFGVAVLIDCHSMPSTSLYDTGSERPDFVLGDRFSTSCHPEITRFAAARLKSMGYIVAFNKPYAGGFITEHYGRPAQQRHALQIEVNRSLYMDESRYRRSKNFVAVQEDICTLAADMIAMTPSVFNVPRAAAE